MAESGSIGCSISFMCRIGLNSSMGNTDRTWQYYGRIDPYYGVLAYERFTKDNIDEDAKLAFFVSGEDYIDEVFTAVRDHLDADFVATRALDFGCGVGRLTL